MSAGVIASQFFVLLGVPSDYPNTEGVGAASGIGAAAAVGNSTSAAIGLSAGVGAALAVSDAGVGSAAGVGAAVAVGAATFEAIGTAAGVGAGSAVNANSDPFLSDVVLLLPLEGADESTTITDVSNSAHTMTVLGNAKLDDAVAPPFGTTALKLDGVLDAISAADHSDFQLASTTTSPFTLEMFIRPGALNSTLAACWHTTAASARRWRIQLNATNLLFSRSLNGVSSSTIITAAHGMSIDNWYFLSISRGTASKLRVHLGSVAGGVAPMIGSVTEANAWAAVDVNGPLRIGGTSRDADTDDYAGLVKAVRITADVCRYDFDTDITIPTAAFPTA